MDVHLDGLFNQNGSYDYDQDYVYEEDVELKASKVVLIPLLYSLELVIGLLGNGLLLAVLAQKIRSWTITDTFVLHQCVADVLLLLTLPLWAAQAAQQRGWCFGDFLCKISGAVFNINFFCGIFLLVCISLDFYLSIAHTTQLYSKKNPRLAHISYLSVWIVSIFLTFPDCFFLEARDDLAQEKKLCFHSYSQPVTNWQLASRLLHHTLGFLLPSAALIICCSCILQWLQRSSSTSPKKQRAIMIMLTLVVVFLLCWMPYNITLIVDTFKSSAMELERSLKKPLSITSGLGCMHACLRPLLYLGLCANFRKRTLAMLRCDKVESESWLWELDVGEKDLSDQNHEGEELNQRTCVDPVQSAEC